MNRFSFKILNFLLKMAAYLIFCKKSANYGRVTVRTLAVA
jgi:hypothetical protein